ncbi:DUF624 domain-containing protein [Ruania suaedae]|uniref:DUF624 domain-containing protein n=1 Tax=Ruania suaedae TaxID=2897774 RepID=UPI001E340C1E|nr:DUF624 domain-containing protein [Ruania suaedae]UFU03677.1 DUF624 domain-containing protein [Ruania suaedae]
MTLSETRSRDAATPTGHVAPPAVSGTGRLYGWAEALAFMAMMNILVVVFTLAGAVLLGWAPAVAAAVACSRRRLRSETHPWLRTFATIWRREFWRANRLQAAGNVVIALLASNLLLFRGEPGHDVLAVALAVALGLAVVHQILAVVMDAHYELGAGECLRLAGAFAVRFPGAPLLLAVATALATAFTIALPGLLPVLTLGAWLYLCTALCLSFFAANDRALDATL